MLSFGVIRFTVIITEYFQLILMLNYTKSIFLNSWTVLYLLGYNAM
jgi:hypothetical protein